MVWKKYIYDQFHVEYAAYLSWLRKERERTQQDIRQPTLFIEQPDTQCAGLFHYGQPSVVMSISTLSAFFALICRRCPFRQTGTA